MKHWLTSELLILQNKYPAQGSDIPELDRTKSAVRGKACYEGIRFVGKTYHGCANPECETPWMKHMGHGLCVCCYQKDYYKRNKERLLAYSHQWKIDNPERFKKYNTEY